MLLASGVDGLKINWKRFGFFLLMGMAALFWSAGAMAASLIVMPRDLGQAQPALVKACFKKDVREARVRFVKRDFDLVKGKDGCFVGVVTADLTTKPGDKKMRLYVNRKRRATAMVEVQAKDYGTRRITVDPKFMRLTKAQLARHKREMSRQKKVYARNTSTRYWRGGFIKPVDNVVVGNFGRKSVINGKTRSPHGGVDLRAAKGVPIRASAAGKVALVDDTYFGGKVVLVDHGLGLVSAYRHLSKIKVRIGQKVAKGQVVGLAGSTGRVTGPHLHFDFHLAGARMDPLAWIEASKKLAAMMGD